MKVNFSCEKQLVGVIPEPVNSLRAAPEYFRKIKPQSDSHPGSGTVKRCVPFLDALSSGFIIPFWSDVYVLARNGELSIDFPPNFPAQESLGSHPIIQIPNHPLAHKPYGDMALKFINPWVIETDPGVSCIFTSPFNHMETRFKILDGIVDTDTYYNSINFPFIWTGGDGEFIIQRGTPLVQVIPFRRETFELEFSVTDSEKMQKVVGTLGTKLKNGYREEFWHNRKNKNNDEEQNISVIDVDSPAGNKPDDEGISVKIEDPLASPEWKSQKPSGILEVVADDKDRGFGEGGF